MTPADLRAAARIVVSESGEIMFNDLATVRAAMDHLADLWEAAEALSCRMAEYYNKVDPPLNAALARLREVGA